AGSFRDPAGYVVRRDGRILRRITPAGRDDYRLLMGSGLYDALVADRLLVPHRDLGEDLRGDLLLSPEELPFVSYPSEWCFSALRDAALLTLRVQRLAVERGMTLRDASAYNVQFRGCRPVFIDTSSFARREPGAPWAAYRQFCMHFLAPLAIMAHVDPRLGSLFRGHLDGVPLDLASRILPLGARLRPSLLVHLLLHGKMAAGGGAARSRKQTVPTSGLLGLLDDLSSAVRRLRPAPLVTPWRDYDETRPYAADAAAEKARIVGDLLDRAAPRTVWDFGCNAGTFARIAAARGIPTVGFDADVGAVEAAYRAGAAEADERFLPLVMDLANPTGPFGWAGRERMSLVARGPADLGLFLALVHHLVLANNLSIDQVVDFAAEAAHRVVVEFVPPDDPQALRLSGRPGIERPPYDRAAFESAFGRRFRIEAAEPIAGSGRVLYLYGRIG
ncbi:MAG: SAM-dependent methyltransferase, partial [Methanobacteriota archaeon]